MQLGGTYMDNMNMHNYPNKECCFCGKPLWNGYHTELTDYKKDKYFGHNTYPVSTGANDRCCAECNDAIVIPERLRRALYK